MVSNSGGETVRPVIATRIAMNRSPTFQPPSSTRRRSGGSISSASQLTRPTSAIVWRAARSAMAVLAASQRLGIISAGSGSRSFTSRKPMRSPTTARVGRRSWTTGSRARSSPSVGSQSMRPAARSASRKGRRRSIRSSAERRRIHWPFSHSSRSRSKMEPALLTLARSNRSVSSESDRTSSSVPVDQPSRAR